MEDVRFEGHGDYYRVFPLTEAGKKLVHRAELVHRDQVDRWKREAEKLKLKILIKE